MAESVTAMIKEIVLLATRAQDAREDQEYHLAITNLEMIQGYADRAITALRKMDEGA